MNFSNLFEGYPRWVLVTMALTGAAFVAFALAEGLARLARSALDRLLGERADSLGKPVVLRAVQVVRIVTFLLFLGVLIAPALSLVGVATLVGLNARTFLAWLIGSGLRIGFILLVSYLIIRIAGLVINRFEQNLAAAGGDDYVERGRRIRTVGQILEHTLAVIVSIVALLMILRELGLDVAPLLAGVGIAGVALGFGAQSLVRDFIGGFFLIVENQVRVGDVASINGTAGAVEAISLRTIVLRDLSGTVHVFPNGSITTLANMTKDYSYAVMDLAIPYHEDLDRIVSVLKRVAAEMRRDPIYQSNILDDLEVLGVENFTEGQVVLRMRVKTLPLQQWAVGRELRRRIKLTFDAEGIELPVRQFTLHISNADLLGRLNAGDTLVVSDQDSPRRLEGASARGESTAATAPRRG